MSGRSVVQQGESVPVMMRRLLVSSADVLATVAREPFIPLLGNPNPVTLSHTVTDQPHVIVSDS